MEWARIADHTRCALCLQLLLSDTPVLNQFGFVLVAASLVDTFVVRTLLVPALMFFAVDWNWWPGRVPTPRHH